MNRGLKSRSFIDCSGIRVILLFAILVICPYCLYAQPAALTLDSLRQALVKTGQDTNRLAVLKVMVRLSVRSNPAQAREYSRAGLELANKLGSKNYQMVFLNNNGVVSFTQGNYNEALQYFRQALQLAQAINDQPMTAMIYCNIGECEGSKANNAAAYDNYAKALKIYKVLGDLEGEALALSYVAGVLNAEGKYEKALEYRKSALTIMDKSGKTEYRDVLVRSLGKSYDHLGDHRKALAYFEEARKIAEETGNKQALMNTLHDIATTLINMKDRQSAADYLMQAMALAEELGDADMKAYVLSNIGALYLEMVLGDGAGNVERPAATTEASGYLKKAIVFMNKGIAQAKVVGNLGLIEGVYKGLAKAYELSGDYRLAYEAHSRYITYHDSVYNKETTERIAKAELESDFIQKQLADSLKNAERAQAAALKLQKQKTFTYLGAAGVIFLIAVSFWIFRNGRKLSFEKQRSEDLLLNILPGEIADELKQRGAITATDHDNVTILFTDFVNFTLAGERMGTQKLVEELHTCFKTFDEIVSRHNLEKIKTIGDAYLAVGGLPLPDSRHAENVLKAAMEIRSFMLHRRRQSGDDTFEIRIGIHSGSVVAGIVGVKKFAYDIWGDTVNTAARMEQRSEPGKINISQTTFELVKDKYACTYRGEIEAKNKGMLKMYFVEEALEERRDRHLQASGTILTNG